MSEEQPFESYGPELRPESVADALLECLQLQRDSHAAVEIAYALRDAIEQAESETDEIHRRRMQNAWPRVKARAEAYVKTNGWPGFNNLQKRFGCSKGTMRRAVQRSVILSKAQKEYEGARRKGREVPLSERALDDIAQSAELDPLTSLLIDEQASEMQRENRQAQNRRYQRSR